jgi:hypothetical protein
MLGFLADRGADRKLRLFACACCRRIWDRLPDERSRAAVECAERFADGMATVEELRAHYRPAREVSVAPRHGDPDDPQQYTLLAASDTAYGSPWMAAASASVDASWPAADEPADRMTAEWAAHAALLRDLFGNPFRSVLFDPRWRTGDVVALARAAYEDHASERLPMVADALMDAGCADEAILAHCRSPEPHVRGCWVVDLALGKE